MEKNVPIRYKGQPLKDVIEAKGSNNSANTLKAPKVIYVLIII